MIKKLFVGLVCTIVLAVLLSSIGYAYFTDTEFTGVKGRTGTVKIHATNIAFVVKNFQPGDRQNISITVKNNGKCPYRLDARVVGLPGWLRAQISPSHIPKLNPGQTYTFRLRVWMPVSVGNSKQNKPINFKIKWFARNVPRVRGKFDE